MKAKEIQNTINTLQESINAMRKMLAQAIHEAMVKVDNEMSDDKSLWALRNAFHDSFDPSSSDPTRWISTMKHALELKNGRDLFDYIEVTDEVTKIVTYPIGGSKNEHAIRRDFLRAVLTELGEL